MKKFYLLLVLVALATTFVKSQITVTVNSLPVVTLTSNDADNTICPLTSVMFTASPAGLSSYTFRIGTTVVQTGASNTYTTTGLINNDAVSVSGTNGSGCSSVFSAPITMTVVPLPIPTLVSKTNPTTCGGSNGTATVSGGSTYSWNTIPVQTGATATNLVAGTYTCTVTNTGGCSKDITVTLSDPTAPNVTLTSSDVDNTFCEGTSLTFTAGPVGLATYNFTVNGVTVQNTASNIYTTTTLTNNSVVNVSGVSIAGCTGTAIPITNTVNSLPIPSIISQNNPTTCGGSDGSIIVDGAGVGGSYSWNTTPIKTTATASNLKAGTYICNITTSAGCSVPITATLNDPTAPVVTLTASASTICAGTNVNFTATGATNYEFFKGATSLQNGTLATYSSTNLVNGDVISVKGTTTGCSSVGTPITMVVNSLPIATFGANQTICSGNTVNLTVTPTGGGTMFSVLLNNNTGDLVTPNNTNPVTGVGIGGTATFSVAPTTTTTYHWLITNENGCSKLY